MFNSGYLGIMITIIFAFTSNLGVNTFPVLLFVKNMLRLLTYYTYFFVGQVKFSHNSLFFIPVNLV